MVKVHLDFETRSKVDLKEVGSWRYAEDPSTEVLCAAFAVDDGPVQTWVPGEPAPLFPEGAVFCAHNVQFEIPIWHYTLEEAWGPCPPDEMWDCTMGRAAYHRLPMSLEKACMAMGLYFQKDTRGARLMQKLCQATGPIDPEEYKALIAYCKNDVECERELDGNLGPLPPAERAIWLVDLTINRRGVPVDVQGINALQKARAGAVAPLLTRFRELTGVNPTQTAKVKAWFADHGLVLPDLKAETLDRVKAKGLLGEVLNIRKESSATAFTKLEVMKSWVMEDNRLRGLSLYHGAGTGRWTSKGPQFHNLKRNGLKALLPAIISTRTHNPECLSMLYTLDQLSQSIRSLIVGPNLGGADYNAIEPRVLFWLVDDQAALDTFRSGGDIYVELSRDIYPDRPYQPSDRAIGKLGVLGCGYQAWVDAFVAGAAKQGVILTDDQAKKVILAYRNRFWKVVNGWEEFSAAAFRCMTENKPVRVHKVAFHRKGRWLCIRLPSGRDLHYFDPKIERVKSKVGVNNQVTYLQEDKGKLIRKAMYGGIWTENIVQAIARDVMANGMKLCEERGLDPLMSIHDELIVEKFNAQELQECMLSTPSWGKDIPLKVEPWGGEYYGK